MNERKQSGDASTSEGSVVEVRTAERERPSYIVSTRDVPESADHYPGTTEILSHGRRIGEAAGLERLGVNVERLPPGHRTSYPHAHEDEEEFVYVLSGEVQAWIDGELYPMTAGDLAAFPAGTGIAHSFLNNGRNDAVLLVGGERSVRTTRIAYPLNPEWTEVIRPARRWTDAPARPLGKHPATPTTDATSSSDAFELPMGELVLRNLRPEDWEAVHEFARDPEVVRYQPFGPNTEEETRNFVAKAISSQLESPRQTFDLAVTLREGGALIGTARLGITNAERREASIGYTLHPAHWRRGHGTQLARGLVRFGFDELGLYRIFATCDVDNDASARVLAGAGMRHEGTLRGHLLIRGEWRDSLLFAILATDER